MGGGRAEVEIRNGADVFERRLVLRGAAGGGT
jgi:hypothetical protein